MLISLGFGSLVLKVPMMIFVHPCVIDLFVRACDRNRRLLRRDQMDFLTDTNEWKIPGRTRKINLLGPDSVVNLLQQRIK